MGLGEKEEHLPSTVIPTTPKKLTLSAIVEKMMLDEENMNKSPEVETIEGCDLVFPSWAMKMRRSRSLIDGDDKFGKRALLYGMWKQCPNVLGMS